MRILTLFVLCLLFTATGLSQESDRQTVERLARKFGEAWLTGDARTLDSLLAREYTHTDVTGKVLHRNEWLSDAANVEKWARTKDNRGKASIEFLDTEVVMVNGVAVMTGENVIRPDSENATPMRLRFTQIWVREDGNWKRRYFQATPVK